MRKNVLTGLTMSLIGIIAVTAMIVAGAEDVRVANAAMKGDREAVRSLLKEAADVNAAQGDGMTALHWAAMNNDVEMTQMLLYAGANVRAATRIGGYTPLFMAAKSGSSKAVEVLLKAGSDAKLKASDGLTPLMAASMGGDRASARLLLDAGAEPNAKETELGQTALIFAASFDRAGVVEELVRHGADINQPSAVRQPPPVPQRGFNQNAPPPPAPAPGAAPAPAGGNNQPAAAAPRGQGQRRGAAPQTPAPQAAANAPQQTPPPAAQPPQPQQPPFPDTRGGGNPRGGLTPLMYASREGSLSAVKSIVAAGANLNLVSGDKSTAVLLAAINGKFDVAKFLVDSGADLNIASMDGAMPLNAVVHTQWSRESFHPQPTIKAEKTTYLELMKAMLDKGADPNAQLQKPLWYSSYGYVYEAASEVGTTAFWRCAQVADMDGMKLLLSRGADPRIANKDGVTAFLAASGAGAHGNDEVTAAAGRMAAVRYLVEELHFDVNSMDNGSTFRGESVQQGQNRPPVPAVAGQPPQPAQPPQPQVQQPNPFAGMAAGGFTALHNAAHRGDNEMILYLVTKGAKVDVVTGSGITVADMANGPRQRVQPFPETVALLEMLGSRNSHKCVSC